MGMLLVGGHLRDGLLLRVAHPYQSRAELDTAARDHGMTTKEMR